MDHLKRVKQGYAISFVFSVIAGFLSLQKPNLRAMSALALPANWSQSVINVVGVSYLVLIATLGLLTWFAKHLRYSRIKEITTPDADAIDDYRKLALWSIALGFMLMIVMMEPISLMVIFEHTTLTLKAIFSIVALIPLTAVYDFLSLTSADAMAADWSSYRQEQLAIEKFQRAHRLRR